MLWFTVPMSTLKFFSKTLTVFSAHLAQPRKRELFRRLYPLQIAFFGGLRQRGCARSAKGRRSWRSPLRQVRRLQFILQPGTEAIVSITPQLHLVRP